MQAACRLTSSLGDEDGMFFSDQVCLCVDEAISLQLYVSQDTIHHCHGTLISSSEQSPMSTSILATHYLLFPKTTRVVMTIPVF